MAAWTDQQLVASLLLLIPVAVAALALASARWQLRVVVLPTPVVPRLTTARRRQWQVLRVPLRQPDLPGRPQPRAPGRR